MRHLIVCPELSPAPIPAGGIGTYVAHISRLLAEEGEVVHVIGRLWEGAPRRLETRCGGRLLIHRVPLGEPVADSETDPGVSAAIRNGLLQSEFPGQLFSWQVSLLAESLVEQESIDVIEAQEYDAPLYYFQLRRSLGLGPRKCPPILLHLHSPTEFIVWHNEYDAGRPDFVAAMRMEAFSIAAADAWLCPSRYYARQAGKRHGLESDAIRVLPLPSGDMPVLDRDARVWESGSICYVGRLEPRKGVIEWVDAAVSVARADERVVFEFVGADLPYSGGMSVLEYLLDRIPREMTERFRFYGQVARHELVRYLGRARIAVVPSRWENFPNTCVEAMSSGLPVIASPEGGMVEMIRDGQSGWIAASSRRADLAGALKRALSTSPSRLAEMGRQAAADIRRQCDNQRIVERHRELRREIAGLGARRSHRLPTNLPWPERPMRDRGSRPVACAEDAEGIAVLVHATRQAIDIEACMQSIQRQTHKPQTVVLLAPDGNDDMARRLAGTAESRGWLTVRPGPGGEAAAKNAAVEAVLAKGASPFAFVFLDGADRLSPDFTRTCEAILRRNPEVGVVSSWWALGADACKLVAHPCPAFPYQLLRNEAAPATAVRTIAFQEIGGFRENLAGGFEDWELINSVMANGWCAVTVPMPLSMRVADRDTHSVEGERMRREMLARFSDLLPQEMLRMVCILESRLHRLESMAGPGAPRQEFGRMLLRPRDFFRLSFSEQVRLLGKGVRNPRPAIQFLVWHTSRAVRRFGQRVDPHGDRKKDE